MKIKKKIEFARVDVIVNLGNVSSPKLEKHQLVLIGKPTSTKVKQMLDKHYLTKSTKFIIEKVEKFSEEYECTIEEFLTVAKRK